MKLKLQLAITLVLCLNFSAFAQVTSSNEVAARNWIKANAARLNINPSHTFQLRATRKTELGETLRFQQMVNNVPVFDVEMLIHFDNEGKVNYTEPNYDVTVANINTTPSFTKENAIAISNEVLKIDSAINYQECNLYVYNKLEATKLVYRVVTDSYNKTGSWETIIDAQTGNVISTKDIALYHKSNKHEDKDGKPVKKTVSMAPLAFVSGSGMVFNPDPLSQAGVAYAAPYSSPASGAYPNDTDATNTSLNAARTSVTLPEIDLTAGVYKLKSTYAEIKELGAPAKGLFTQATATFNFTRFEDGFEAVNAFYHIDKSLRYINQTLGIPCVPYQAANAGVVFFDPHAEGGTDNSHYSAGQLHFGEGGVDDAEDADVVLHELGHGIHDWITSGGLSQVNGLSEGCGDYWAVSYSRSLNQWASGAPQYDWVFSWDGHNEWWTGRITNYPNVYPGGLVNQIHTDGQIWATSLMKIWDVIGRVKTDKAFLNGLDLTTSSTSQPTAAVAVRQAAISMNYPCADIMTITEKFNEAGYAMPTLSLTMAPIANQTVTSASYTSPSYAALANPISPLCTATLTQSPAAGTVFTPGVYTITMTANLGTATVVRTFTLTVLGLGVDENIKINTVIFPNPATNQITIKGEFDANESVSVFNLLGQKVLDYNINSNEETINISKLATGVYTIFFNTSKESYKFIKE